MVLFWIFLTCLQFFGTAQEFLIVKTSKILSEVFIWQYRFEYFFAIFIIIFNFNKTSQIENFLKSLKSFDEKLEELDWRIKIVHHKSLKFLICVVMASIIMMLHIALAYAMYAYFGIPSINTVVEVLKILSDFIVCQFFFLVSLQFISSVACVVTRLTILTNNIKELLPLSEGQIKEVQHNRRIEAIILRNIAILYDNLLDAVDQINEVFSNEMTFLFLLSTAVEVLVSYFMIKRQH
ncbi:CLUMA_CG016771, isoform A [Clunio marinus]|uniref:CLUMA_CG016771, isoform A n=1 Tax=Clunio marinus TaxID=568069 RepID=A0A1J1IV09_9DIPT|nr:CLUMA_CG016771, isoform A [Clunio marinus]